MADFKFSKPANMIHSGKHVSTTFRTRNVEDTIKLAEAFAAVVALENRPEGNQYKTLCLGLKGKETSGKAIFSTGVVCCENEALNIPRRHVNGHNDLSWLCLLDHRFLAKHQETQYHY